MENSQLRLDQIKMAIDTLNQDIKNRLERIKDNKIYIDTIFEKEVKSEENDLAINTRLEENRELLDLNRKAILFHTKLVKYYVDRLNGVNTQQPSELDLVFPTDPERTFELTLKGELPLSGNNPLLDNEDQLVRLLQAFEEVEAYEKCAIIKRILDQRNAAAA